MLIIRGANVSDAGRIAEIYVHAMSINPFLIFEFPTPESRKVLIHSLTERTVDELETNPDSVLVGQDSNGNGEIVGFLKWTLYECSDVGKSGSDPAPAVSEFHAKYLSETAAAREKHMRDHSFIRQCDVNLLTVVSVGLDLNYLAISPEAQNQGVARSLIGRITDIASTRQIPVYLEATMNAVKLYEKFGWKEIESIHILIPEKKGEPATKDYEEICMVWHPLGAQEIN
ncbi:uncharacterized protein N7503_003326 [Penicillium pulvis]|uniref:uncharacterized protein n=1 Tax=Penicillium pulvis TaxID=1562058 RepID=UPI00254703AF|nr:uncharacterized protein N7503_003326 [Penicillium pulvis]KAJ5805724.1 hypothetical protein N7503_003326 [Penicillium pulvis]